MHAAIIRGNTLLTSLVALAAILIWLALASAGLSDGFTPDPVRGPHGGCPPC